MITANNLQHVSFIALFFSFLLLLSFAPAFEACSSRPETSGYSCPPFISTLSFPFSPTLQMQSPSFRISWIMAAPSSVSWRAVILKFDSGAALGYSGLGSTLGCGDFVYARLIHWRGGGWSKGYGIRRAFKFFFIFYFYIDCECYCFGACLFLPWF